VFGNLNSTMSRERGKGLLLIFDFLLFFVASMYFVVILVSLMFLLLIFTYCKIMIPVCIFDYQNTNIEKLYSTVYKIDNAL